MFHGTKEKVKRAENLSKELLLPKDPTLCLTKSLCYIETLYEWIFIDEQRSRNRA